MTAFAAQVITVGLGQVASAAWHFLLITAVVLLPVIAGAAAWMWVQRHGQRREPLVLVVAPGTPEVGDDTLTMLRQTGDTDVIAAMEAEWRAQQEGRNA